jgi:hypothetical protein
MKIQAWLTFINIAKQEVSESQIFDKLRRRFESHFRFDEKGLPRVWKPSDDIDSIYSKAKEEVNFY